MHLFRKTPSDALRIFFHRTLGDLFDYDAYIKGNQRHVASNGDVKNGCVAKFVSPPFSSLALFVVLCILRVSS